MNKIGILILLLALSACSHHKFTSDREGQSLPSFNLELSDSVTTFNTTSIPREKPFIIFLFQPYCPYCRAETYDILKNMGVFQNTRIYMITSYSFQLMKQYTRLFQLEKYHNITIVRDSASQLLAYFKAPGVPYFAFYDELGRLNQVVIGKEDIKTLIDIVSKLNPSI